MKTQKQQYKELLANISKKEVNKMKVRLIIQSTEDGNQEIVHFTDDFEAAQDDFKIHGHSIDYDKIIDADIPNSFPLNYDLIRR
jgi:hypothetical protein